MLAAQDPHVQPAIRAVDAGAAQDRGARGPPRGLGVEPRRVPRAGDDGRGVVHRAVAVDAGRRDVRDGCAGRAERGRHERVGRAVGRKAHDDVGGRASVSGDRGHHRSDEDIQALRPEAGCVLLAPDRDEDDEATRPGEPRRRAPGEATSENEDVGRAQGWTIPLQPSGGWSWPS